MIIINIYKINCLLYIRIMIIDNLIMIADKIKELDEFYNKKLDNYYQITDEMRERAKTNNFMKLKIILINNRKLIGVILLAIFIIQIVNHFNCKRSLLHKNPVHSGGAASAAVASAAKVAAPVAADVAKSSATNTSKTSSSTNKLSSLSGLKGKVKSGLKRGTSGTLSTGVRLKRAGFEITDRLKALSGIYFEIFYTISMAFLIGITLGPIIMIIVIFIVCFSSFRDQMVSIKRL